jgi:putative hemolysin
MAIVIDEYGGTAGLVTLDDLISQIVGDVADLFDKSARTFSACPSAALIDGLTQIEVAVNDALGLALHDENYDTIAGYMLGQLGRMARVGDTVEIDSARLKVEALDGLRIARMSLVRSPKPDAAAPRPPARPVTRARAGRRKFYVVWPAGRRHLWHVGRVRAPGERLWRRALGV